MVLSTPSSGMEKSYIKKVYREAEGLRLESINPDYDDLFAPYEDEPKIRRHCGRAFSSTWGLNMLFDYSREPHSDIAFVDMKSFLCQLWMCPSGAQPLDDFPFASWVGATIQLA